MKVDLKILEIIYNTIVEESDNIIVKQLEPSKNFISLVQHYFLFGIHYSNDFMQDKSKELENLCNNLSTLRIFPITTITLEEKYTPYFKTT